MKANIATAVLNTVTVTAKECSKNGLNKNTLR